MSSMDHNRRWRKALIVSCIAHMLLLIIVGWLGLKTFLTPLEPELIDMELISESSGAAKATAPGPTVPQIEQVVQTPVRTEQPVQKSQPMAAQDAVAERYVAQSATASQGSGQPTASTTGSESSSASNGSTAGEGNPKSYVSPQVLSSVNPKYPAEARQAGVEGTVFLKIEVLESGNPGDIQVVRSSGRESLDNAALEAIQKWRFVPALNKETGRAMRGRVTVPIKFELY